LSFREREKEREALWKRCDFCWWVCEIDVENAEAGLRKRRLRERERERERENKSVCKSLRIEILIIMFSFLYFAVLFYLQTETFFFILNW